MNCSASAIFDSTYDSDRGAAVPSEGDVAGVNDCRIRVLIGDGCESIDGRDFVDIMFALGTDGRGSSRRSCRYNDRAFVACAMISVGLRCLLSLFEV